MATHRLGRSVLIQIDSNNVGGSSASWSSIPQQTDCKIDCKADKVDITVKGDNGWTKEAPVGQGWTITCTCLADPADSTYAQIWNASMNMTKLWVKLNRTSVGGTSYEFQTYVTLSEDAPLKDKLTASLEFSVQGQPVVATV
jgi:hypothetical protein